jgi:dTDP-4-amino-4,6-dideoxygalactose transaminase
LLVKLAHLEEATERRRANAQRYTELFAAAGIDKVIQLPSEAEGHRHVWNQFTVRVPNQRRDALRQHLADHNVGSEIYYPVPLHRQQCFRDLPGLRSLPETDRAAGEVLSLPIFPELTEAELSTVVMRVEEFVSQQRMAA